MRRHLRLMSVAAALAASILLGACKNTADAEEPEPEPEPEIEKTIYDYEWRYAPPGGGFYYYNECLDIYEYLDKATPMDDDDTYHLHYFKFSEGNYITLSIRDVYYFVSGDFSSRVKTVSGTYTGDLTKNGPVTITFEFNGTDFTLEGNLVGDTIYFGEYPYKKQ